MMSATETQQPFRFLDLPAELRYYVYDKIEFPTTQHVLDRKQALLNNRDWQVPPRGQVYDPEVTLITPRTGFAGEFLSTCHLINKEAREIVKHKVEQCRLQPIQYLVDYSTAPTLAGPSSSLGSSPGATDRDTGGGETSAVRTFLRTSAHVLSHTSPAPSETQNGVQHVQTIEMTFIHKSGAGYDRDIAETILWLSELGHYRHFRPRLVLVYKSPLIYSKTPGSLEVKGSGKLEEDLLRFVSKESVTSDQDGSRHGVFARPLKEQAFEKHSGIRVRVAWKYCGGDGGPWTAESRQIQVEKASSALIAGVDISISAAGARQESLWPRAVSTMKVWRVALGRYASHDFTSLTNARTSALAIAMPPTARLPTVEFRSALLPPIRVRLRTLHAFHRPSCAPDMLYRAAPAATCVGQRRPLHLWHTANSKTTLGMHKILNYDKFECPPLSASKHRVNLMRSFKDTRAIAKNMSLEQLYKKHPGPGKILCMMDQIPKALSKSCAKMRENDTPSIHNNFCFAPIHSDTPAAEPKSNKRGRIREVHLLLSNPPSYMAIALERAYRFIKADVVVEFSIRFSETMMGKNSKAVDLDLPNWVQEHFPHLRPDFILKSMPEGSAFEIKPMTNGQMIKFVIGIPKDQTDLTKKLSTLQESVKKKLPKDVMAQNYLTRLGRKGVPVNSKAAQAIETATRLGQARATKLEQARTAAQANVEADAQANVEAAALDRAEIKWDRQQAAAMLAGESSRTSYRSDSAKKATKHRWMQRGSQASRRNSMQCMKTCESGSPDGDPGTSIEPKQNASPGGTRNAFKSRTMPADGAIARAHTLTAPHGAGPSPSRGRFGSLGLDGVIVLGTNLCQSRHSVVRRI
ncbi:hypothetical protein OPT61_g4137 [Boeremia exigua]|uniref:Uncharacterized protein n=1 Tax=Boeremia exigua TaxID=749465 RepID=A0ACC2IFD6_9PLEO|nr:hypothetical protein OPT61_g4137 [Boeremia exigua]